LTPGSTFKPFVALSALKEGIASLARSYDCPGEYRAPGDESGAVFHNWTTTGLGYMSLADALRVSCDTIFYQWGYDFWNRWRQNPLGTNNEPFQRDLRGMGFGRPTEIDLPSEADGLVPGATYAPDHPELFYKGQWVPGGDILISIGSSYVTVTPLQLATAYAAIANGGKLCRPHVVERIVDASGETVRDIGGKCKSLGYPKAWIEYIRRALTQVPESGTATSAFSGFPLSQIPVAGKTGTAEREPFQDTSWFASMVPAHDPQYVIVVMAEQGGFGSDTAAPIARRIIERMYGIETAGSQIVLQGAD
jgi:penicillin-binding protein 2